MSRKFTIGYYVANRPDDPVYRIRAVHDGEQPPREAVWSGTGWDAAVTAASEANYRRQQRERGKFVFHVLPYKYAEGIIYVPDRTHYRLDEVPPVLPNEITQSENYAIARRCGQPRIPRERAYPVKGGGPACPCPFICPFIRPASHKAVGAENRMHERGGESRPNGDMMSHPVQVLIRPALAS